MEVLRKSDTLTLLIKSLSEENGIQNHVVTNVTTNKKGEGYLGDILMVTVKDKNSERQLEVVIKAAYSDSKIRDIAPVGKAFQNEIYFFTSVLPVFEKFGTKCGVYQNIDFVPKCLRLAAEEPEEVLVLENLLVPGFEVFDKKAVLNDEHVRLIFKTYGKLHGYSFALRDQKPDEYKKVTQGICNMYEELISSTFFSSHLMEISKLVQNTFVPEEDAVIMKKYKKYSGRNIVNIFHSLVTQQEDQSVILHGDCWSNNMLFKYENATNGRIPIDMRLIDWQLMMVGSPVCDLSYFFYCGSSKIAFDNLDDYLRVYYESFSFTVAKLGSNPTRLFPFSSLKKHWQKYSKWGMFMACTLLKLKLTNSDDCLNLTDGYDINEMSEVFAGVKFDEEAFGRRVRGILWHMSEIDAL